VAPVARCKGEEVRKAGYSKKKGDVEVTHRRGEEGGVSGQNPWRGAAL
jgi:hypothetical protein